MVCATRRHHHYACPMKRRYLVKALPGLTGWGIVDTYINGAYCALPAGADSPLPIPLEWPSKQRAEAWLYACRVAWSANLVPAPEGWNGDGRGRQLHAV